jgi:hypothetical protein
MVVLLITNMSFMEFIQTLSYLSKSRLQEIVDINLPILWINSRVMENTGEEIDIDEAGSETGAQHPLLTVLIYGAGTILLAGIAKLIVLCVNYPGTVDSVTKFFQSALESVLFVLNFEFKVWWVFLLVLYLVARFYKSPRD